MWTSLSPFRLTHKPSHNHHSSWNNNLLLTLAFLWVDKTPLGGFSLGSLMGLQPDGGLSWSHLKARQGWPMKMVSLCACLVPHLRCWKSWELPGSLRLFMQPLYVASLGFLTAWKVVGLLTRWLAFLEQVFQDAWVKITRFLLTQH